MKTTAIKQPVKAYAPSFKLRLHIHVESFVQIERSGRQVAKQRSAKPFFGGSIPSRASNFSSPSG
jgi:hypothetical protein